MGGAEREPANGVQRETFTDERGVTLTKDGVARAGRRLAETRSRHTPEYFAALRDRLGIAPVNP
jgi:hypothetical protein